MDTKFNKFKFNSQLCTSIEQSRRLLELGLKKETADMNYTRLSRNDSWTLFIGKPLGYEDIPTEYLLPAWSLHRLIEMMPISLPCEKMQGLEGLFNITWHQDKTFTIGYVWSMEKCGNLYDAMVDAIEWLIKEGYFPKEYLV